ncbi:MAG TPA: HD domain-containing protein, partial [Acidimicrobiales bacterium]
MEHALAPAGTISWAAAASADARGARWRSRPVASFLIRLVAVVVPAVSSFAVARWLGAALAEPVGLREATAWWVFVAVGSGATLLAVDRVTRGLLPLAMLLRLAIAFPREAPSYAQVALRAVTARRNVERLRASDTAGDTSAQAAADLAALVSTAARHGGLTRSHAERVCAYADAIAAELGLGHDDREQVRWVALLHDVGELSVRGGSNGSLAARIVAVADVYD